MRPKSCVCVFSLLLVLLTTQLLGSTAMALEWQDIAGDLMSPACPGRTLLNCTSGQAEQWRELIRQKLAQGETEQQIMQYFVAMRGEEILAAPPKHGFALAAWLFPLLVIINGAGLILILTYKWSNKRLTNRQADETGPDRDTIASGELPPDPYRERLQRELKDFTT